MSFIQKSYNKSIQDLECPRTVEEHCLYITQLEWNSSPLDHAYHLQPLRKFEAELLKSSQAPVTCCGTILKL